MIDPTSIDLHYHANPDLYVRRHSALVAGRLHHARGREVVLVSHLGSTVDVALAAHADGLPVHGSFVMNACAGGLDWRRVLLEVARYAGGHPGRLLVSFPSITGRAHPSKLARSLAHPALAEAALAPMTTCDEKGRVRDEVRTVLALGRDHPILFATGHATAHEVRVLVEEATRVGLDRILITQPANPMTGISADGLRVLTRDHPIAWVEQTALTRLLGYQDRDDFERVVSDVERVVFSSDLGQTSQPDLDDFLALQHQWFSEARLDASRIEHLCSHNPRHLLRASA